MKKIKQYLKQSLGIFLVFTVLCGVIYPFVITGVTSLLFPEKANGSIIEKDGVKYGSSLIGQKFTSDKYLWGRESNLDVSTYQNDEGVLLYGAPFNISPASEEYGEQIKVRAQKIREANPEMEGQKVPVDLVTGSGSGLDPHISVAAAMYQTKRIAKANAIPEEEVVAIINKSTTKKAFGILGEEVVSVLEVNLRLEGIIE